MRRLGPMLQRFWRGERGVATPFLVVLTLPAGILYGAVTRIRNLLYDHGILPTRAGPIPVVSVGNLAVGGTGKTPVAAWTVSTLREAGRRPALVTRGYGEDELLLHRRWNPDVPVIRARRRLQGVREAARLGCDVAVLDDGFQHRGLARDLDLVLLSPVHPLPPRLLPRGPFRESLRSLRRAHALLVTRKGLAQDEGATALVRELEALPGGRPVYLVPLTPGPWRRLDGTEASPPEGPLLAVASVAEPASFLEVLRERTGTDPELLAFPDHHVYREPEVRRIADRAGGRTVVTTEKDAVKLEPFREWLPGARVLPLVPEPPAGSRRALGDLIRRRVGEGSLQQEVR
jgi:tetraacyldisaccharide 4'-kinase